MTIAQRAIAAREAAGTVVRLPNKRTPAEFAEEIRKHDTGTVDALFLTATMVETSHDELGQAQWLTMCRDFLKWSRSKSFAILRIGRSANCNPELEFHNLSEVQHAVLPGDWTTLAALASLTPEQFQKGLDTGIIHAGMERKDIKELKPPKPKKETAAKISGEPKTGDEWQSFLWSGLSKAAVSLQAQDRAELFSVIRQHIDNLERKLDREGAN